MRKQPRLRLEDPAERLQKRMNCGCKTARLRMRVQMRLRGERASGVYAPKKKMRKFRWAAGFQLSTREGHK